MNTLTALIIDDEKHAREGLASLLRLYCPKVQVVGDAGHIENGVLLIQKHQPEVVFLDIEIGEENGFQLLDQLPSIGFQVVFTTAYSEFAIKAFRYHAIDYLLKPIEPKQLMAAVETAMHSQKNQQIQQQVESLRQYVNFGKEEKMIVSTMEGLHVITIEAIVRIAGSANYSTFHLDNGDQIMASKNLKYYEDLLPTARFFRSHQSHLVNLRHIKKISTREGFVIELEQGASIPLAKRRKEDLLTLLRGR